MKNYHIVKSKGKNTYTLYNNNQSVEIVFDDLELLEIFKVFISNNKVTRDSIKLLFTKFIKNKVLLFFNKLKELNIIFFENQDYLIKGFAYEENKFKLDKSVGVISFDKELHVYNFLRKKMNCNNFICGCNPNISKIESFVKDKDLIIVDNSVFNHDTICSLNKILFKNKKKWILYEGIKYNKGYIGPLFTEDTACYQCLLLRMKSNDETLINKEEYYNWLIENNKFSIRPNDRTYTQNILLSYLYSESIRFLIDYPYLTSYGTLLSMDIFDYDITKSKLYKVPFCPVCSVDFDLDPWEKQYNI